MRLLVKTFADTGRDQPELRDTDSPPMHTPLRGRVVASRCRHICTFPQLPLRAFFIFCLVRRWENSSPDAAYMHFIPLPLPPIFRLHSVTIHTSGDVPATFPSAAKGGLPAWRHGLNAAELSWAGRVLLYQAGLSNSDLRFPFYRFICIEDFKLRERTAFWGAHARTPLETNPTYCSPREKGTSGGRRLPKRK